MKSNNIKTLVVDISYIPRCIINTERAFVISWKGNADVLHEYDESFKIVNPEIDFKKPSVIRVKKFVNDHIHTVPLTRENVYRRDGYQCIYCGENKSKLLTIDHIIPKSKGGENTWQNMVTACKKCNNIKSDLSVEDFGKVIPKQYRPHYLMFIKSMFDIPEEWKKYLLFK